MIKLVGALLIVSGTAAWGIGSIMRMKTRSKALAAIMSSLEIMAEEIGANLTPMPALVEMLSNIAPKPADLFYRNIKAELPKLGSESLGSIWQAGLDNSGELMLERGEKEILSELGWELGKYDGESQRRMIQSAIRRLKLIADMAESERRANSRLHGFLGVAAGMFAVVVLI